jgi:hypothetical protein
VHARARRRSGAREHRAVDFVRVAASEELWKGKVSGPDDVRHLRVRGVLLHLRAHGDDARARGHALARAGNGGRFRQRVAADSELQLGGGNRARRRAAAALALAPAAKEGRQTQRAAAAAARARAAAAAPKQREEPLRPSVVAAADDDHPILPLVAAAPAVAHVRVLGGRPMRRGRAAAGAPTRAQHSRCNSSGNGGRRVT